nr:class I SAM-dependent methyltransferase [Ancylobacter koreensis]
MPTFLSRPSFDQVEHLVESAWLEHAPFAFHLVAAVRPKVIVELGTHHGFSFLAFCQAIRRYSPGSLAHAVDTWQGDEHAGHYGEEVFEAFQRRREGYADISNLVRSTFSQAVGSFADGSIDLLHIDGRHYYEDVGRDFAEWLPKLSRRGVVLFHDTEVRQRDFGVWKLFEEISARYPHFNFHHGHGLGILAVGEEVPEALRVFFEADAETADLIRTAYARLGAGVSDAFRASRRSVAPIVRPVVDEDVSAPSDEMGLLKRRLAAVEEFARRLDAGQARLIERQEVEDPIVGVVVALEQRVAKAERRIARLTWHAGVLMPLTAPVVAAVQFVRRKYAKFRRRRRQRAG